MGLDGELVEKWDYRGYEGAGYPLPTAAPPHKVKLNQGSLVRVLCGDPGSSGNFYWKPLISGHFPKTKADASLLQWIPHLRLHLYFC